MDRFSLEELQKLAAERFPEVVARFRPYRGHQRPRDRGEVEVLIALAVADWRRAEAEGEVRWLPDGRLAFEFGITRPVPPPAAGRP